MKKKVTQETANRLRELLEKVTSEREDAPFAEKSSNSANAIATYSLFVSQVSIYKMRRFSIIGDAFATIFEVGVWGNVRTRGDRHRAHFLTWSSFYRSRSCLFLRRYSFKKEFNALVERAKEEVALGKKKPLRQITPLVKGLEGFLKSLQTEYQFEQKKIR